MGRDGNCAIAVPGSRARQRSRASFFMTGIETRNVSLRLNAALLDHAAPLLLLAGKVGGGLLWRTRDHRQPPLLPELHLVGRSEHLADMGIERVDDRARGAFRRHDDEPGVELVIPQCSFWGGL